jgi:uncharacterized membrane protein
VNGASDIGPTSEAGHNQAVAHGHSHGSEVSWRPERRIRLGLIAALVPFAIATVVGLICLWPAHEHQPVPLQFTTYGEGKTVCEKGRVVAVSSRTCGNSGAASGAVTSTCTTAKVAITSGPDTGHQVTMSTGGAGDVLLAVNDKIRVLRGPIINPSTGERAYSFDDFQRDSPLIVLAIVFAVLLVGVARWRGIMALVGLVLAYLVLAYFVLPALLDGRSPVLTALVGSAAILLVVLYIAHGVSYRTTTALLGTLVALAVTAGFAAVATSVTKLTGHSNEYYGSLQAAGVKVSISGLILVGLIIGALGVINDITVTQASSVWELSASDPHASWRSLFTRGMRIGRDHIASVIYTLVFAYTGAALPVLLIYSISGRTFHDLLTGDEIAGEIVRDLVGVSGILLAVPLTTLIAALVATRPHEALRGDAVVDAAPSQPQPKATEGDPGLDALEARIATSTLRSKPSPFTEDEAPK